MAQIFVVGLGAVLSEEEANEFAEYIPFNPSNQNEPKAYSSSEVDRLAPLYFPLALLGHALPFTVLVGAVVIVTCCWYNEDQLVLGVVRLFVVEIIHFSLSSHHLPQMG